jgi:hypothetical protein
LEDYKNQFDILALKVHRLPDKHKLSFFLGGLKDEIQLPVWMFNHKTLVETYSFARCCVNYNTRKCTNHLQYSVLQVRGRSHKEMVKY